MSEYNDPFFSHHVDEFIEQITSTTRQETQSMDPEVHLIHDLQILYGPERRRFSQALQRVEDRLVEKRLGHRENAAAPVIPFPEKQRLPVPPVYQGRTTKMNDPRPSRASRLKQRLGLMAAILIVAVLVGSLLLVLNYTHSSSKTASGGPTSTTPGAKPPTPTPSPTATPAPATPSANIGKIVYMSPASYDDYYAFAWSPDSKRVASSTAGMVTIQDATTGKHAITFVPPGGMGASILTLSWSPDGKYLAVGSNYLFIINATTGTLIRTFPDTVGLTGSGSGAPLGAHLPFSGGNMIYANAWSPAGKLMVTSLNGGVYGNIIDVWNPSTGQVIYTFRGQTAGSGPSSVSWSPDGKYIASASYSGNTQVWDAHTGKVIFSKDNCGQFAAWSPENMELALSCDNVPQIWDVTTNRKITTQNAARHDTGALVWSPDGREVANASSDKVEIWDAASGQVIYTFSGQGSQYVRALAWSPDGKYIISGGGNESGNNHSTVWIAR